MCPHWLSLDSRRRGEYSRRVESEDEDDDEDEHKNDPFTKRRRA